MSGSPSEHAMAAAHSISQYCGTRFPTSHPPDSMLDVPWFAEKVQQAIDAALAEMVPDEPELASIAERYLSLTPVQWHEQFIGDIKKLLGAITQRDQVISDIQLDSTLYDEGVREGIRFCRRMGERLAEQLLAECYQLPTEPFRTAGELAGVRTLLEKLPQQPPERLPPDVARAEVLRLRSALRQIVRDAGIVSMIETARAALGG